MANAIIKSSDTLLASLAECYITIPVIDTKTGKETGAKNRYNFMQAINLEAKFEKQKIEVPRLGSVTKGNRSVSLKLTGSATFHYNSSIFRKIILDFQNTGRDIYFDIRIINNDKTSAAGKQEIILKDCNIDNGTIAKFDANGQILDEQMNFTFESFKMPKEFSMLLGMEVA